MTSLFLLFFFTWWNIVGWSNNAISESISISFMLLWFASILWYYHSYSNLSVINLLFISILFSFTRDSWPYIILSFFVLNFIMHFFFNKKRNKVNLLLIFLFAVVFGIQNYTMKIGERNVLPIFNSIAIRITQNQEYLNWFEKEGMPCKNSLIKTFKEIKVETFEGKQIIYNSYIDTSFTKLFNWIKLDGKTTYQKFILSHPNYFFLQDQTEEQINRIFIYNVKGYYQDPRYFFTIADKVFPLFNNYLFILMIILCTYIFYKSKKFIYLISPLLGFLFIINSLISYNADSMEVERHLFITVIGREFLCAIALFLILDYLLKNEIKLPFLRNNITNLN